MMPKRIGPEGFLDRHYVARIQNEVDVLSHLGPSLGVIYFFGAFEDSKAVYLVLELCTGGELWSRIKRGHYSEQGKLPPLFFQSLSLDISSVVQLYNFHQT